VTALEIAVRLVYESMTLLNDTYSVLQVIRRS
jgi:hypothetical protein